MIAHTESFQELKKEQQKIMDFTVLVCYGIPSLKKAIKGKKSNAKNYENLAKPDYFNRNYNPDDILELAKHYKNNLAKYTLLSAFSFFEVYIKEVINELVKFHGGKDIFISNLNIRHQKFIKNQNTVLQLNKKKLQEYLKKKNKLRYAKHLKLVNEIPSYRNPSELLATYGLKTFIELVNGHNFKSVLIPDLLEFAFCIDLTEKLNSYEDLKEKNIRETFDIIRDIRNSIGHGKAGNLGFEKAIEITKFLRKLSLKIDKHLVENFFILERDH